MQIFVAGTWSEKKAAPFVSQGIELGKLIAAGKYDLACGPGTGMAKYVIEGYRSVEPRGKVRFYLPTQEEMAKVGEEVGIGADEIIETGLDYPLRNIFQIKASDALFIITGGDGTLEEAITALVDYNIPVGGLRGSGTAVQALELLTNIYPSWKELLIIHDDLQTLFTHVDERLKANSQQLTSIPN